MAVRSAVAFVAILLAIVPLGAWARWDKKLDPAAVKAMCQASRDAGSVKRHAERDFEDAAAASARGGWDQSLTIVPLAERERWRRLSAELMAASRKRADTNDMALAAGSDLSVMRAKAVHLKDDVSIIALEKCGEE